LTDIQEVAGFTGQTADPIFVVWWDVVARGWFGELCYCVAAFVTDFDVCVYKKFVIFRMCGEEKVKVAHFVLFSVFLVGGGVVILYCICCFSFCSRVVGKLLDVAMWSMVFHSLSWQERLRGSLSILAM